MVFLNAAINRVLPIIAIKLSNAANSIGEFPSHFKNARTNAKITGPNVNTAKPIKLGAIKEYAIKSLFCCLVIRSPVFTCLIFSSTVTILEINFCRFLESVVASN